MYISVTHQAASNSAIPSTRLSIGVYLWLALLTLLFIWRTGQFLDLNFYICSYSTTIIIYKNATWSIHKRTLWDKRGPWYRKDLLLDVTGKITGFDNSAPASTIYTVAKPFRILSPIGFARALYLACEEIFTWNLIRWDRYIMGVKEIRVMINHAE